VPPPLDPQLKADILRDIQDTTSEADPAKRLTRNEIARRRGVSQATVSKIAKTTV
jgi:DNA-binding MurR/RpiR family transcriptional regulator